MIQRPHSNPSPSRGVPRPRPIAAAVLLAGGLKPSPLASAARRSVLDLHLTAERTVLGMWLDRLAALGAGPDSAPPPARVIFDSHSPAPTGLGVGPYDNVRFQKEPHAFRGPAGAVKDVCADVESGDSVLVCDAGRYLDGSLVCMLADHDRRNADITIASDADESPSGLYLIRGSALALIPQKGFLDLKEQFLERALKAGLGVWVHRLGDRRSYTLRTRAQFLAAAHAAARAGRAAEPRDPLRVIAPDADVEVGAHIVDSVVMPGARVEAGCVIARSLVCPGARVPRGMDVLDAVVSADGIRSDNDSSEPISAVEPHEPGGFGR